MRKRLTTLADWQYFLVRLNSLMQTDGAMQNLLANITIHLRLL